MNSIMKLLRSHRSIRKFTDQPVADDLINEIIRCGQSAATSSNLQATTVIRVREDDTRREIGRVAGEQQYVVTAGAFLVFWQTFTAQPLPVKSREGNLSGA